MHQPFFNAIHLDKKRMVREELKDFFANYGVGEKDFDLHYQGLPPSLVSRPNLINAYGITGVPAFVNGKYRVSASSAGGEQALLK